MKLLQDSEFNWELDCFRYEICSCRCRHRCGRLKWCGKWCPAMLDNRTSKLRQVLKGLTIPVGVRHVSTHLCQILRLSTHKWVGRYSSRVLVLHRSLSRYLKSVWGMQFSYTCDSPNKHFSCDPLIPFAPLQMNRQTLSLHLIYEPCILRDFFALLDTQAPYFAT